MMNSIFEPMPGAIEPKRTARRKFSKPPVKLACLSCRSLRIRCDGQEQCANCVAKNVACSYVPSKRGGPRNCQNRKRRRNVPTTSTSTDAEEASQESVDSNAFMTSFSSEENEWFNQLVSLSGPGAGLRNVETPITEIESIFDSIFAPEPTAAVESNPPVPVPDLVQLYGSNEDILDAYYVFIHPYYPILPPPERVPVYNRPLSSKSTFQPSSPVSLAISAILVLIPHPEERDPSRSEYVKLRRDFAHSFAQSALEAVEVDSELLSSSNDPGNALSEGAPEFNRELFHPKLPVGVESVLALVLLSVYEYSQRGNMIKMRNRAGQALTAAISMSLHEMVEEDEFAEARRRAWWMTYMTVCQGSIVSNSPPVFDVYDPRFVTPHPEGWKMLIEAQQTILEATTFVHDLNQTQSSNSCCEWVPRRMLELDSQITSLLLTCRDSSSISQMAPVALVDTPEAMATKSIRNIAEIKLHSARIKTHRFCAFQDIPIFLKRHCDLQSTTNCGCGMDMPKPSAISTPDDSSLSSSTSGIQFPFSSHASSKNCLHAALSIATLLDNLPYPNPTNEIPWTTPPYLSATSRVEVPRTMPTFACCAVQSSYAMLMLCFKARAFHQGKLDETSSSESSTLTGFLNELQQNLRIVVKSLTNYSIAFEALQGMRDEISQAMERTF